MQTLTFDEVQPKWTRKSWNSWGNVSSFYEVETREAVLKTQSGTFIAKDQKRFNGNYTVGQKFAILTDGICDIVVVDSITLGWEDEPYRTYQSLKELKQELGLKNNREVEYELDYYHGVHVNFKWLDGTAKDELWGVYLYEGRWSLGSGAIAFKAVELEDFDLEKYEAEEAAKQKAQEQKELRNKIEYKKSRIAQLKEELAELEAKLES